MTSTNLFNILPRELRDPSQVNALINWLLLHHITPRDRRKLLTHWAKIYNVQLTATHYRRVANGQPTLPPE